MIKDSERFSCMWSLETLVKTHEQSWWCNVMVPTLDVWITHDGADVLQKGLQISNFTYFKYYILSNYFYYDYYLLKKKGISEISCIEINVVKSFFFSIWKSVFNVNDHFLPRPHGLSEALPFFWPSSCYVTPVCVATWFSNAGSCESALPPFTSTAVESQPPWSHWTPPD